MVRTPRSQLAGSPILIAVAKPTEAASLDGKERRGDTGDVWTPVKVDKEGPVGLTVGPGGFSYRLMTELLFPGDYGWKPALQLRDGDGPAPVVVAQVLVRGQGKTEGYHQRLIPIPAKARRTLLSAGGGDKLRDLARERVQKAGIAQGKVLRPALCALLQGGSETLDFRDPRARVWLDRFDTAVDQVFFEDLWEAAGETREAYESAWNERLRALAREQLEQAIASAPVPVAQRPRAVARAELLFHGTARNHLPTAAISQETVMEEGT